jgi:hypothetical protein
MDFDITMNGCLREIIEVTKAWFMTLPQDMPGLKEDQELTTIVRVRIALRNFMYVRQRVYTEANSLYLSFSAA